MWVVAALLLAAVAGAALWAVQTWQTNRAIANVESSVTLGAMPARQAPQPGRAPGVPDAMPEAPADDTLPVASSGDRLPPLILPGQPVPAAVLRDLPEWVAAEVAPESAALRTSGASGDESAAPAALPASPQPAPLAQPRQRNGAAPRGESKDRYSNVFARCPGPGVSGAVQCRRAVCSGAARKAAACAPYLN